jgi:hypothetical protein
MLTLLRNFDTVHNKFVVGQFTLRALLLHYDVYYWTKGRVMVHGTLGVLLLDTGTCDGSSYTKWFTVGHMDV